MRDYQVKTNEGSVPDSIAATKLGGGEITSFLTESKTAVSKTGQTLSNAAGVGEVTDQLSKSLFINGASSSTFQDNGSANTYQLTPATGVNGLTIPDSYDHFEGGILIFLPATTNPGGASTLKIGQDTGSYLGSKKLLNITGSELGVNVFDITKHQMVLYNSAADSGTGAFLWLGTVEPSVAGSADAPRGNIDGFIMSNDADIANDLSIEPGACRDSTNVINIALLSTMVKRFDAVFAEDTGNGGFYVAAAKAADTWYNVFSIIKDTNDHVDIYADISIIAANIPADYTKFRRIGSFLTDGAGDIIEFIQYPDGRFLWKSLPLDQAASPGVTTMQTLTISIPLGVPCLATLNVDVDNTTGIYIKNPSVDDQVPSNTISPLSSFSTNGDLAVQIEVMTDENSQINWRLDFNRNVFMTVVGWIDFRGKDA